MRGARILVSTGLLSAVLLSGGSPPAPVVAPRASGNVPAGTVSGLDRAAAADDPVTVTDLTIAGTPEADGRPVALDVSVLTTPSSAPRPAVVLNHGFGGDKTDAYDLGRDLARQGYVVITWTQRGFGASGGRIHLDDPRYEGRDAQRIVDLAASRADVARQGEGDPVIGFAGASYGGAISLVVAGLDRRVDAIVPGYTWHDLNQALLPQYAVTDATLRGPADVRPVQAAGVFKQRWASLFFASGLRTGAPTGSGSTGSGSTGQGGQDGTGAGSPGRIDPSCGRFSPELCAAYQQAATSGGRSADLAALLDRAGPKTVAASITAPTLFIQGETDTLFPLDEAEANARALPAGTERAYRWDAGGHDGQITLDTAPLTAWFDRHLKSAGTTPTGTTTTGATPADDPAGFSYAVPPTALVGRGDLGDDPDIRRLAAYPADPGTRTVALAGDPQTVVAPPGGSPAALTNLPGSGGVLAALSTVGGYALAVLPGQSAVFTSAPTTAASSVVGSGRVRLTITSTAETATVFVSLWDLGPDSTTGTPGPSSAVLPQLAVAPVAVRGLTPGTPRTVDVALPGVAHDVPVGHRLQLVVASTDQAYALPRTGASYRVALDGGRLVLPVVDGVSITPALDVPRPLVVSVAALVLAALAALAVAALRRRAVHPRVELRDVPLRVDGLVKTYGSSRSRDVFKAVDGVSFEARPGQVVGLLGPNGAGKTTTLRMLVGLIRPDAGTIYVRGEPVHAGADVLGEVGALIEGPGFLPHLSGLQNLRGYWAATGRPLAEAHLDEALAIAGLGSAVHRRVRGYSQGMRQRLGIAQAMLGLPSLLLLDEPTNGLDPPQIKAMRTVLADYAAAGRTVVVSSHLLAEVQQTCSHVVVMDHGTVVLSGSVAALTASNDVTLIGLADPADTERAVEVITEAGGRPEVGDDGIRVHGDLARPALVAALVGAGIGIDAVDGHRQLEEVFMSLVGENT